MQRSVQDKLTLLRQHDDGVPWTRIAAESGVPLRTLNRWAPRYRLDSASTSVQRSHRVDRGTRRIPSELVEAIEELALRRPAPTAAFIHRRVGDIARELGLAAPSYSSVRTIIASIDPGLRTLAQHGDTAYRNHFELVSAGPRAVRTSSGRPITPCLTSYPRQDRRPGAAMADRGAR
nr:helix-turn-helix domain-containing protein [Arthrobacter sp. H5]